MPKPRILFIHSEIRTYRVPIFELIARHYPTLFVFMSGSRRNDELSLPTWDCINLKSAKFFPYQTDVSWALPKLLWLKQRQYEIIIASGMFSFSTHVAFLFAKLLKKKLILWDETWLIPHTLTARLITPYLKIMCRQADACIAAGTKAKELYLKLGAKPEKIFIAPNCARDLSKQSIEAKKLQLLRQKINPDDKVVISYLGRVAAYKNLDNLIKAFYKLEQERTDVLLLVVGSGPAEKTGRDLWRSLGAKNIYWVGRKNDDPVEPVPFEEMVYYFHLTDIFVLPGKFIMAENVPAEAWGLTLNEAMSLGKSVITTDSVAAGYDLVKNRGTGLMVKNNDWLSLYQALEELVGKPELRDKLGRTAKTLINSSFTAENMFEGFRQAVESVGPHLAHPPHRVAR